MLMFIGYKKKQEKNYILITFSKMLENLHSAVAVR